MKSFSVVEIYWSMGMRFVGVMGKELEVLVKKGNKLGSTNSYSQHGHRDVNTA